ALPRDRRLTDAALHRWQQVCKYQGFQRPPLPGGGLCASGASPDPNTAFVIPGQCEALHPEPRVVTPEFRVRPRRARSPGMTKGRCATSTWLTVVSRPARQFLPTGENCPVILG